MNLIPISKPVRKNNFDEVIVIDSDVVIIKTRNLLHHVFQFKHGSSDIAFSNECIFPTFAKTNTYDKEILKLADEIIDIVYRAILSGTERNQTGKINHSNGITQSIDTLMYKGLTLELAVNLTHTIEFDTVNSIVNVFPLIDSDNFIKTPCKGYFKHGKFIIFAEYINKEKGVTDRQQGFIINAEDV